MGAIEWVTSLIGTILYPLFSVVFLVIDVLQDIFGAFAGIDNIVYDGQLITSGNTGAETDTGIVYFLLTSDLAKNIFFSMLILAIILLLIFLAMAFIRNVYSEKTKNWKEIVGLAIKGIGNFIFIPVGALLGIWLGNIVLQAINGATASGNSLTISRQLFVCSAYNANKLRGEEYQNGQMSELMIAAVSQFCSQYGISVDTSQTDPAYYADCIDDAYGTGGPSISWYWEVDDWYSLWNINYVVLVVGGIFILYVFGALSFGMVKRLFMLLLLFIISPIVCSMYPIDNGNAAGNWRKTFLKHTISAYSAVAGLNLFFALLPIIQNIEFADGGATGFDVIGLTSLLLLIAGLYMVKEFISVVNSFIGAEDAYGGGVTLFGMVGGRVRKGMGHATKFAVKTGGAFGKAAARGKAGGAKSFFKSLGGSALESIIGEKDKDGNRKGGLLNTITTKGLGINYQDVVNETTSQFRDKDGVMEAKGKQERALRNARRGFEYRKEEGPDGKKVKVKHEFTDEEMQQLYKDSGISDKAVERIAKQKGVKKEDVEKSLELEKDVNDKKKDLDKNAAKYQQMRKGENIKVGDQEVKDMDAKAKEDFLYRAENNLKYSESELSIDTVKAAHIDKLKSEGKTENVEEEATKRAREEINQKLATNKAIDEYTQTKQKASDSSKEFIDALKKVQKEDKASKISIDDKDIENLSTSIENALNKDADISGIEFNKVIDKVNELQRSVENEIGKQLKKVAKSTEKEDKDKKDSSHKG